MKVTEEHGGIKKFSLLPQAAIKKIRVIRVIRGCILEACHLVAVEDGGIGGDD